MRTRAAQANDELLHIATGRLAQAARHDPDLQQSEPLPGVLDLLQSESLTSIEVFARACEAYAGRPALGERAFMMDSTPEGRVVRYVPVFRTITYRAAWQRTVEVATGLVREARTALRPGEVAGIYGFGSVEYVIADLACLYAGVASAVLQLGMAAEDLRHIVNEAAFACMICGRESLGAVLKVLPACPSVRSVVVMDLHGEATLEVAEFEQARALAGVPVLTLHEVAALGRAAAPLGPFIPAPGTDPLVTLMYTSGSTGFPKGAMMTRNVWRTYWSLNAPTQFKSFPNIGINFYPLSHIMGRQAVVRTLLLGGVTHFTLKSDLSTLFEDIRLVRPTFLNLVPRISEMIHQAYRTEVARQVKSGLPLPEARSQVRQAMRSTFLGDRMTAAFIGSAPTAPEVVEFLVSCFDIPVFEGYGSTEAGILTVDGEISRPSVTSYKLVDVPELGYRLSDRPYPRGELLVKTRHTIPGFFQNVAATQALYDPDRFLRTGDIVEERAPDHIVWVDRKNNVVKLSQGEYITLWRLESTFSAGSPLLDQVYLYANSQRAYPLAVVVPEWAAVDERLRAKGEAPTPGAVKQLLRGEFNRVAGVARLRSYEAPRDFLVETERWTRENGFLTGINKPARPQMKTKYGERLEGLYHQLEEEQDRGLAAMEQLEPGDDGTPMDVKVRKAVEAVLGVPELDLASGSFKDFGGDSISALSLSTLLEEVCGVPVPAAAILEPGASLETLVARIEARQAPQGEALPGFASIHAKGAAVICAEDLRLHRFLGPEDLAGARAAQPLRTPVGTVLLTGANGFLGHILCLEWMERLARSGGRVYTLVRASNDHAAASRLHGAFRTGDPELEQRFARLAAQHLVVLAGHFAAPRFGLTGTAYEQLAEEVDLIVHPGALVNHVLSYEQLFEPNVLGTAQLIRLALHKRRKRFDYISTIGVLEGARAPGKVSEREGVDALKTEWPVEGGYAHGYATSKWASEVLLKELHGRFGIPVRVFRPDMILPHRRYRGQANAPDMLTRLLASVIYTGLAPRSFYAGPGVKAHYDGLPVDFIAAAMGALSSAHGDGHATYQVSNAHWDDGISLDSVMDWVESAGYPLERMSDYGSWYEAFSARLQALPAAERHRSSLPILSHWAEPSAGDERERVDASQFQKEVKRRKPGGEGEIPHLSEAFIHKYLEDMRALGLLEGPGSCRLGIDR